MSNPRWLVRGEPCQRCGQDQWVVKRGYSECRCGQKLWVERWRDPHGGVRFRYRQGPARPVGYHGQMAVTK